MALISANSYGNLGSVSISSNQIKNPTKFFAVYLTGKRRGTMNPGFYQCPVNISNPDESGFFIHNQDTVYFIPLYMKKYWVKNETRKDKNGENRDFPVAFGWDENSKKIDGAKTEYIIAGYLWDNDKKNIVKHPKDLEDNQIKSGEPVLIYFRCKGTKCNCAYELVSRVNEAAKSLSPLSDNPTFEQSTINPRRFLIKTTIVQRDSKYGPFDVFDFHPTSQLPDDLVLKILDAANNKYFDDFNKQFDRTEAIAEYVKNGGNSSENIETTSTQPTPEDTSVPDLSEEPTPGDDFNIDIM